MILLNFSVPLRWPVFILIFIIWIDNKKIQLLSDIFRGTGSDRRFIYDWPNFACATGSIWRVARNNPGIVTAGSCCAFGKKG